MKSMAGAGNAHVIICRVTVIRNSGVMGLSRLSFFQDILSSVFDRSAAEPGAVDGRSTMELCESLLTERGELSGTKLARAILDRFEQAADEERLEFFELVLEHFDINASEALEAITEYSDSNTTSSWKKLVSSTEPRRRELFRRLNRVAGATSKLVLMREQLFKFIVSQPDMARLDVDFEHLFSSWFNRGFLVLRQIDWNTPASILEKIIQYEAVHAINDWKDLRGRLEPEDRRCFAFFHPAMPGDPLIFVEVALTRSLPDAIQEILNNSREPLPASEADTAVFYSISNCQPGLRGVSFGHFLIKQVASQLSVEFPNLSTFRTLSPVPTLMNWAAQVPETSEYYNASQIALKLSAGTVSDEGEEDMQAVRYLSAEYIIKVRRDDHQPMDPVARFHLGNGASLSQIVPAADLSVKGLSHSAGVMVSYLYDLDAIESNHEAYANQRMVPASKELENLISSKSKNTAARKNAASIGSKVKKS